MENKKGFFHGALFGALAILLLIVILKYTGLASVSVSLPGGDGKVSQVAVEKKIRLMRALAEKYFLYDLDGEELAEGIYAGYVSGFEDEYAAYYDEEATKELTESTTGEFCGIGALVSQQTESKVLTVTEVYEDSPAEKAGMKEGDILYKVDGKDITGQDINEVVSKLKGEEGTTVKVTVLRGADAKEVELKMTRAIVETKTVSYEMKEDQIGYIRVSNFEDVTTEQYREALETLAEQGMKGLVVDLRNNPGGNYDTVCAMLDEMLPEGVIVYTEDKAGNRQEETSDAEHQFTKPLAVLINERSASASEIYAGAIQDYGIGEIVGTTSFGKGVVQGVFDLKDGTSMKLTISQYFTPKGRNIQGKGIKPDVEAAYEYDEEHPEKDNQLDKAVEVVKQKMGK